MAAPLHVKLYSLRAQIRDNAIDWQLGLEVEGAQRFELAIRDGAEVPVLLEILRRDPSLYFDPQNRTLSTGWNIPGK